MEKDFQSLFYNKKTFYSSLGISSAILVFLLIVTYNSPLIFYVLLLVLLVSILLHMRWLMKIYTYEEILRTRSQEEALRVAMAANATIILQQ